MSLSPRERLIVALDIASPAEAETLVARLRGRVGVWKIGYQLAYAGGLHLARELAEEGEAVFLDLKLHDIDTTVEKGVESVLGLGARFLTVHAYPQVMAAAVKARGDNPLKILAVTVLTSMDQADLDAAGYALPLDDLVARRVRQGEAAGIDGVVCSPRESALVKRTAPRLPVVTPGIRPKGAEHGDQKRVLGPAEAVRAGIDYLVVGRPITAAPDPAEAAEAIVAEIAAA